MYLCMELFTFDRLVFGFVCDSELESSSQQLRFGNLRVEAEAYVGSRALPTIFNFVSNVLEVNIVLPFFNLTTHI